MCCYRPTVTFNINFRKSKRRLRGKRGDGERSSLELSNNNNNRPISIVFPLCFRLHQTQDGGRRPSWKTSNGHISAMHYPIHCICRPMYVHRPYFAIGFTSIVMEIRNLFRKGGSLADPRYKEKQRKDSSWERVIAEKTTRKDIPYT